MALSPASRAARRFASVALGLTVALLLVAASGALWARGRLLASLPQLGGERTLQGLGAPVTIARDGLGVPTISAASRADVARALGFVHAQDRFFQMDLLRRRSAGELAELFGPAALGLDRETRIHQVRARARRVVEAAAPVERALLEAYTAGVNGGLAALRASPPEHLVLRVDPAPWRIEDSVLTAYSMFLDLNDELGTRESALGLMRDLLPPGLFDFLVPRGTEWDAPLLGDALPAADYPGPDVVDLRSPGPARTAALEPRPALDDPGDAPEPGSNNWAVAGRWTATGGALLAGDMHLGISVPNIWYRASFEWRDDPGGAPHRVTGVTLPGTPSMIVGSNTRVAWAFTNTQGDWSDLVVLEADPNDPDAYLGPGGPRKLERHLERIRVKNVPDETLEVLTTIWGPVVGKDHRGRLRAVRWIAHDVDAVNINLGRIETAGSLEEAQRLANESGAPPQNFVAADAKGRVGWTVLGRIPRRVGFDGLVPVSWADGRRRWDGWLSPEEYPRIVDPPTGRIWTANARVVDGEALAKLGDGNYALGARARQIRDGLFAVERATARDMLRIQLDDKAVFLERWRGLLLKTLSSDSAGREARRAELRKHVENWGGHASVDSVGYRAVRAFRLALAGQVFGALTAACARADPKFQYLSAVSQYEAPLWRLVTEQPPHLLDPRLATWNDQLLAAVDATLDDLLKDGGKLAQRTWGERNTSQIVHPLSRAVPQLGRWLDMPRQPLPGDSHMPRVQTPTNGASQRMVVSPGREAEGFFHMPCGQSGHPFSPYYRSGHAAWARGEPTPFLPGPAVHTLRLRPAS